MDFTNDFKQSEAVPLWEIARPVWSELPVASPPPPFMQ